MDVNKAVGIATEQERILPFTVSRGQAQEIVRGVAPYVGGLCQQMSKFQVENGVLSEVEFPTENSKFWQCVRELWIRYVNLIAEQYEYNKLKIKIKGLEDKLSNFFSRHLHNEIRRMEFENELQYSLLKLMVHEMTIQDTLRIMGVFYEKMKTFKHYETQEEGEEAYWKAKFEKQIKASKDAETVINMLRSGIFSKVFNDTRDEKVSKITEPGKILFVPIPGKNGGA